MSFWLLAVCSILLVSPAAADSAVLVKLTDAVNQGAVCLDGSPPGYYFREGAGANNSCWIIHLEGGGWCYNESYCLIRSRTSLGSSYFWPTVATFEGFLSDSKQFNPDFYDWNVAYIKYCDGASFAGDVEKPINLNGTTIYFRGFRILKAVLGDLFSKGMESASNVILTGCSAGGLATYLHADFVHSMLPRSTKFAALADAGYFIDAPNVDGDYHIRGLYQYVFRMQNCATGVNQACLSSQSTDSQWKCFMAQYTYRYISSDFFVLNSQYDTWQIGNILQLPCSPPQCTQEQMNDLQNFRHEFIAAVDDVLHSASTNGAWLDSCLEHCQSLSDKLWGNLTINGQSARSTVANWYFGGPGETKLVDCPYPCNKCGA